MGEGSWKDDIEREVEWIQSSLTGISDKYVIQIRVTARSKRWYTAEVKDKGKEYRQTRRLYQQGTANAFILNAERNSYY